VWKTHDDIKKYLTTKDIKYGNEGHWPGSL
jgi:hypothetical protein